jgi:hypothetical protein
VAEHLVLLGLTRLATSPAAAADAFHEALTAAYDAGFPAGVADADGIAACEDLRARRGGRPDPGRRAPSAR